MPCILQNVSLVAYNRSAAHVLLYEWLAEWFGVCMYAEVEDVHILGGIRLSKYGSPNMNYHTEKKSHLNLVDSLPSVH